MKRTLIAAIVALGAGFAQAAPADNYITNAKEYVDKADWKNQEVITITLEEHSYTPGDIKLKAGQAYKLEIKNVGKKEHYFTSPEFNRAVAWRKIMVNKIAEAKAPYFSAFEVYKDGQLDLYFVPVTKGTYPVYCTIDDHREKGMDGTLTIE